MIFSTADISDLVELTELLGILFEQEAEFTPNPDNQKQSLQKILLNNDIGMLLIAKVEGKIVGMVNLLFTESTALGSKVALLEDMIIHPNSRSKGIGSKLINYAIDEAKKLGCKRVTLLTDRDNFKAQNFYIKNGFNQSTMMAFRLLL